MPLDAQGANRLADKLRREAEEDEKKKKNRGALSYVRIADGESLIGRLLPPKKGIADYDPYRALDSHWGLGPKGSERALCPRTYPTPIDCVVCEKLEEMYPRKRAGEDEAEKFVNRFRLKHRFMWQLVIREQEDKGPQLWEVSHQTHTKIRGLLLDPDYGIALLDPSADGFDIKVTREGSGTDTTYQVIPRRNPCPLAEDDAQSTKWLNEMMDLDAYDRIEFTEDQMMGFMMGTLSPREVKTEIFEAARKIFGDEAPTGKQKM